MNLFPPANIFREELMYSSSNERWIKHYSSSHNILLVGEGDFSFSLCLGLSFGCATNIVATTLDSYDELIKKYKHAKANLVVLRILGASVLHGVDATNMWSVPDLRCRKFHRIVYNFPHAGFYGKESDPSIVMMHRDLVRRFLQNASAMLNVVGEIHVNHKATAPFNRWRVEDLGYECSLVCIAQDEFSIGDYPGYHNKRGSGSRADEPFPLGSCKTFRFRLHPVAVHNLIMRKLDLIQTAPQMFSTRGVVVQQQPPTTPGVPYRPLTSYDDGVALQSYVSDECQRIFGRYLNHVEETFGDTSYDVGASVKEALRLGLEMYMSNAAPGRPLSDFISILEEFHRLSILRSERLRQMLFRHDLR
ncbi:ferredoxin-fold anticodon-binding domain protein [Perilla frutescens var. hirtella]|uniref:Ferredoxin-fold anticodon-binding domain protein n=1 Tax=Perilla frutescens var. hirtella TaxID=608512 RepID=A0AAD4P1K0_PERFH|nr:ferredoxin-fold anticodon-binding domain protein [Perilla frutescens var. hirtella]